MKNQNYILLLLMLPIALFGQQSILNNGNFQMESGVNIGFYGDVTNNGSFSSIGGEIHFVGSGPQTLNGSSKIQSYDFVMNNATYLKLDNQLEVSNTLTFGSGKIDTDTVDGATEFVHFLPGSSYSGATDLKHINGVVRKTGNTAFEFPVGDGGNLQPLTISAPSSITDHFTAFYIDKSPHPMYDIDSKGIGINHVSNTEWWQVDRTGGSSNVFLTLSFDTNSEGVTNLEELLVVRWDGTKWENLGNGGTTGNTTTGEVTTSAAVSSFSPFTLASSTFNNPLPLELLNFNATCDEFKVNLNWQTASEINNDYFTIERSKDGINWVDIMKINGTGNSSTAQSYAFVDPTPSQNFSYYRLKQTDFDGKYAYSEVIAMTQCNSSSQDLSIYPNPTTNAIIITHNASLENLKIFDDLGNDVSGLCKITHKSIKELHINLSNLSNGIYYLITENTTNKVYKQ